MKQYIHPTYSDNRNLRKQFPEIDAYFEATKKDCDIFPKENGLVVDTNLVDIIDCPICLSMQYYSLFVKWGGHYVQCKLCTHVYVKNRLKADVLIALYKESLSNQLERKIEVHAESLRYWNANYDKHIVSQHDTQDTNYKVLDVGFGAGTFIQYLWKNTSWRVSGLEIAEDVQRTFASLFQKNGGIFYKTPFEQCDFAGERFDLISFWGVMEHVVEPVPIFQKARSLLKDDGEIFVLVPNLFSHAFKVLGTQVPTINPREHIQFFTEKSMQICAEKAGLAVQCFDGELPIIDIMYPHVHATESLIRDICEAHETYYHIYRLKKI